MLLCSRQLCHYSNDSVATETTGPCRVISWGLGLTKSVFLCFTEPADIIGKSFHHIITGCSLDVVSLLQVKTGNETEIYQCVVAKQY